MYQSFIAYIISSCLVVLFDPFPLYIACPTGTYKPEALPGGVSTCHPCPDENHITRTGSTSINECRCNAGFETIAEERRCEGMHTLSDLRIQYNNALSGNLQLLGKDNILWIQVQKSVCYTIAMFKSQTNFELMDSRAFTHHIIDKRYKTMQMLALIHHTVKSVFCYERILFCFNFHHA